jgi:coenzyme F420-reducing hydrogenase alpha subunit
MKIKFDLHLQHLPRIEGHGNIHVIVKDGEICQARWDVVETPRYFEVMLKGKHFSTAGLLTSRICGICSIGHCLASLHATEMAFGMTIPEVAAKLRLLAKHGETLQSHWLHLFFLVAPDFMGLPSVIPLVESNPELIHLARRLRGVGNRLSDLVAGRSTHPVTLKVGGISMIPPREKLLEMGASLRNSLGDIAAAIRLFKTFTIPDFERETEFVSLVGEDAYPWIGTRVKSTDGVTAGIRDYLSMTNEYVDHNNTSKWCRLSRSSFAVGALARLNNNYHLLCPEALKTAMDFGLRPVCHNPYMNNIAQLVECLHVTLDAIRLLEELTAFEDIKTLSMVTPVSGEGVGAVEVPRGILYHHFSYDDAGYIIKANCIIPTTQNNANIHFDLPALVQSLARAGMSDEKMALLCSMLVRAYDPCVSCSVH